jgi:hypothetical protein
MGQKDANAKQTQDHRHCFNHFTHPYLHYQVRSIALACFKIVSLTLRNGFVPSGEPSHAVTRIIRHVTAQASRTHQRASWSHGQVVQARPRDLSGRGLSKHEPQRDADNQIKRGKCANDPKQDAHDRLPNWFGIRVHGTMALSSLRGSNRRAVQRARQLICQHAAHTGISSDLAILPKCLISMVSAVGLEPTTP